MFNSAAVQSSVIDDEPATAWRASLRLGFGLRAGRCQLLNNRHIGPLRLQRLLHPQCVKAGEAVLLHPPGGIAGGDQLAIDIDVAEGACVLVTTPGAAKWYRCHDRSAVQEVALRVAAGSALEWLPQESILFDGCDARQTLAIDLHDDARLLGWDIVQLGRIAAAEPWRSGRWRQQLTLRRNDRLVWCERADLQALRALCSAPQGLGRRRVFGTLWASAPELGDPAALETLRTVLLAVCAREGGAGKVVAAATWLAPPRSLLLVRALADDAEPLRAVMESAWSALRPVVIGLQAQRPRIWST